MKHETPALPYDYSALEPYIDTQTMQLHHDKHHVAYTTNLNAALEKHPELAKRPVESLLADLNAVPEEVRTVVRNHGGGHVNHAMFWRIMKPQGGGDASGKIAEALRNTFTDFSSFKTKFNEAGAKHFGSGWVWLVRARGGSLEIVTTANQDSPLLQGAYPILGNDLWEHAYYLKYQNRRPEYLAAWWNTLNWEEINRRFEESQRMDELIRSGFAAD